MQVLESKIPLGTVVPTIAQMLQRNAGRFGDKTVYEERKGGEYESTSWNTLYENVLNIACNLKEFGFSRGDKIVIFSPNRKEMLELELAVMASGGISVPIFAYFISETAELLIKHSDAKFLAVAGELQLSRINIDLPLKHIFVFDDINNSGFKNLSPFSVLVKQRKDKGFSLMFDAAPDDICLNMYTSGTMGIPKCVQLRHKNILSQQAALEILWNLDENDRFLSYLPWHHSFGGIFERFAALYSGASLSLESGYGKDPKMILENWKKVKPTLFFSVPKVYQALVSLTKEDKEAEKLFFHSGLKFVFTAAAPLPKNISDEFEIRNIPVIEGWGLTETSPCCTLTDSKVKRAPGVVGFPIPGVSIRLADDGEIQVKGPNIMPSYYKNDEANKDIFTNDGWYCTGDIGEITETGLKLISRKDRIFKLLNAEKVIPTELEGNITGKCHYISYAMVEGSGKDYPVAILFPNRSLLKQNTNGAAKIEIEGCNCPHNIQELSKCLYTCLHDINCNLKQKFARIKMAMLIDTDLSIEDKTLTPSLKLAPKNVLNVYKAHIESLYGLASPIKEEVYIIKLEQ